MASSNTMDLLTRLPGVLCMLTYLVILPQNDVVHGQMYLSVKGRNLTLNGEKVFLSGVNQAWWTYANDFGNHGYATSKPHLISTLDAIQASGGNSIRVWVHISGSNTPQFSLGGLVIGPGLNLTRDLQDFVKEAHSRNILVTLTLWNCAVLDTASHLYSMLNNETVLESYLTNGLPAIVRALSTDRAMAIWEIINEPEGCMDTDVKDEVEPCYDTTKLHWWDFADWTHERVPPKHMLRFIALHAKIIHAYDPKALVTVGSWTYKTVTDQLDRRNLYSNKCMQYAAGGDTRARLDLYQIHTYDTLGLYLPHDPFTVKASVYSLDKPVIIGEFSQKKGGHMTSPEQFTWAYYHGYSGAWSWCALDNDDASDSLAVQEKGLKSLKDKNDQNNGGRVNIVISDLLNKGRNSYDSIYYSKVFRNVRWILDIISQVVW